MRPETSQKWMMLFVGLALGLGIGRLAFPKTVSELVEDQEVNGRSAVSALGGGSADGGGDREGENEVDESGELAVEADLQRWLATLSGAGGNYAERAAIFAEVNAMGAEAAASLIRGMLREPIGSAEQILLEVIRESIGQRDPGLAFELAAEGSPFGLPVWPLAGAAGEQLVKDDPDNALRVIDGIADPSSRMSAMYRALQAIARTSPEEFGSLIRDPSWREIAERGGIWPLRSAMEQRVMIDPARAATAIDALPPSEIRDDVLDELANAYVRRDRAGALAWAGGLQDLEQRRYVLQAIVSSSAVSDRDAAFEIAGAQPDKALAMRLQSQVMSAWAVEDAAGAFGWLMSQDDAMQREGMGAWVDTAVARSGNPIEIMNILEGGGLEDQRTEMIGRAVNRWAAVDPQAAGHWVETIEDLNQRGEAREQFFSQSRYRRPEWLAEHVANVRQSDPDAFAGQIGELAHELAEHDPVGALAWAQSMGEAGEASIPNVVSRWAQRDPAAAAVFAASAEAGLRRTDMLASAASAWGRSDPAAAQSWVGSLEGDDRVAASGALINSFTHQGNVEGAAAMFHSLLADDSEIGGAQVQSAAQILTQELATRDRERALALLDQIEDPGVLASATEGLLHEWLGDDPVAASEWVGALEPGQARERGARQIAERSMSERDPEAAFAWAATIQGGDRMDLMESSLRQWARDDQDAAAAALQGAAVSDADRERLEAALR